MLLQSLFLQVVAGIGGLWIAVQLIPQVSFEGEVQLLLIVGAVLGIINTFIKPVLNFITLPIRILTLGLSSLLINVLIIWIVDFYFEELIVKGLVALLWTTFIVWGLSMILHLFGKGKPTV